MTIAEANQFYEQDTKMYEVEKNCFFLEWLSYITDKGYVPYMNTERLQEFIDIITYWYEMKYPERFFDASEGITDLKFPNQSYLSKMMNVQELLYRMTDKQNSLIACDYRSTTGGIRHIYNEKKEIVDYQNMGFIHIKEADKFDISIHFDCSSGMGEISFAAEEDSNSKSIHIENMLGILREKLGDSIDLSSLERCIYIHDCDMKLRRRVLQMAALKMLYSKNTIPEHGYKRAKYFIKEFNDAFGFALTTEEIDSIMENFHKQIDSDILKETFKDKLKMLKHRFQKKN